MNVENIGAYEAKTHFSSILERVNAGESFTITKHGLPVAQLIPVAPARTRDVKQVFQQLAEFRKGKTLGLGLNVRDMIEEGRRF